MNELIAGQLCVAWGASVAFLACVQRGSEAGACWCVAVVVYVCVHVGIHIHLTLVHSCTCVSLVTELLCALDHSSSAFALAQVALQNKLPFSGALISAIARGVS